MKTVIGAPPLASLLVRPGLRGPATAFPTHLHSLGKADTRAGLCVVKGRDKRRCAPPSDNPSGPEDLFPVRGNAVLKMLEKEQHNA